MYASLIVDRRIFLWERLDGMKVEIPWILMTDFNCVLKDEERNSKRGASTNFAEWVDQKRLIDMGFSCLLLTWNHGFDIHSRKSARRIEPLSSSASLGTGKGKRPFRFQTAWTLHRGFFD